MNEIGIDGVTDAEVIGRGAFGTVYRATQAELNRQIAVKVFQGAPDDSALDDFLKECRAVGALDWCPHIVTVFGTGRTRHGEPYLSMEYCPGGSLAEHLRTQGTMRESEVRRVATEVATALRVAHDAGVLHRDVKPANVLVSRSGNTVLADFGIARLANANTRSVGISGTIAFSAAEILNGDRPSVQADVFSYGATLHALLTGRSPHAVTDRDTTQTMIVRAMSGPAVDLSDLDLTAEFAAIIARCLARDPDQRYASFAEIERDLAGLDVVQTPRPAERADWATHVSASPSEAVQEDVADPSTGLFADTTIAGGRPAYPWPAAFYEPSPRSTQTVRRPGPGDTWPNATDYVSQIQVSSSPLPPSAGLDGARLAIDLMGMPATASGQNAVVFEVLHSTGSAAARFFTRHPEHARPHYQAIGNYLREHPLAVVSPVRWFDDGMVVHGQSRPLVLMPWIPGVPLNIAVEDRLNDPASILALQDEWVALLRVLCDEGVAHGDLQCGNVLVDESGTLRLVDLDGFYVPGMTSRADELGHPNFQHPHREPESWGPDMDGFSGFLIALSLRALAHDPSLWDFHSGENLFLSREDLLAPGNTAIWRRLAANPDETVRDWAAQLATWSSAPSPPSLHAVIGRITGESPSEDDVPRTVRRSELPSSNPAPGPSPRTVVDPAPWWDDAAAARSAADRSIPRSSAAHTLSAPTAGSVSATSPRSAAHSPGPGTAGVGAARPSSLSAGARGAEGSTARASDQGSGGTWLNSTILGAIGGFIGAFLALIIHIIVLPEGATEGPQGSMVLLILLVSSLVAAMPRIVPALLMRDLSGAARTGFIAASVGAALGLAGLGVFQLFVDSKVYVGGVKAPLAMVVSAWGLVGMAIGLTDGLVRRRLRPLLSGLLGGLLGGAVGGALHFSLGDVRFVDDRSGSALNVDPSEARTLVAVLLAGLIMGGAVGLANQATKRLWLTVLEGPQRGLEVILDGDKATIGSSGLDTVRLPAGSAQQSHISLRRSSGIVEATLAAPAAINGIDWPSGSRVPIQSGDILRIGGAFIRIDHRS